MTRLKLIVRNAVIILILLVLFLNRTGLYLTPMSAHKSSERSANYGPSKVVYIKEYEKGMNLLGKYDKWVSCNTVDKRLFFFWGFGNQVHGFENDKTKTLDYSWSASYEYYKCYGILNDENINKVEITLYNGEVYTTTDFYEDLFLITWISSDEDGSYIKSIKGYDSTGKIIYEENVM